MLKPMFFILVLLTSANLFAAPSTCYKSKTENVDGSVIIYKPCFSALRPGGDVLPISLRSDIYGACKHFGYREWISWQVYYNVMGNMFPKMPEATGSGYKEFRYTANIGRDGKLSKIDEYGTGNRNFGIKFMVCRP